MIRRADLRSLICTCCGRPLVAHYGRHNERIACEELAERDVAIAAAQACTTFVTAQQLLDEGRF